MRSQPPLAACPPCMEAGQFESLQAGDQSVGHGGRGQTLQVLCHVGFICPELGLSAALCPPCSRRCAAGSTTSSIACVASAFLWHCHDQAEAPRAPFS